MEYFNAVLLPPEEVSKDIVNFTTDNLKHFAEGYCLSNLVLPHITLCQFKSYKKPHSYEHADLKVPSFKELNLRTGTGKHKGFYWVELLIEKESWLLDLAHQTQQNIEKNDGMVLTAEKNYKPHLTLCRTKQNQINMLDFPFEIFNKKEAWQFAIGASDENGQFYG